MNWLDIVLLVIIAGSVASSVQKGLTRETIGLVSVVLALILGTWFYGLAGAFLLPYVSSKGIANFVGFILVFVGVMIAGALAGALVGRLLKFSGLSFLDHLLGALFGLVRGLLICVALVMAAMAFSAEGHPPDAVVRSRVAPYVVDASRVCAAMAPYELKEGFRKTYAQVKAAWASAVKQGIQSMPKAEGNENEREL